MKRTKTTQALLIAAMAIGASAVFAADPPNLGKREYNENCAVCHGTAGKGDGPLAGIINQRVPDLTTLRSRNNGIFPLNSVYENIDGTQALKAHGTRDMPVWGTRYRVQAAEYYVDVPYNERVFVRARILGLCDYLYTLQAP